jgi:AcrR family transcriptional regulator
MAKQALKKPNHVAGGRKRTGHYRAPLSPADWIEDATDVLINKNINALDIPTLCRRLGVSKGSFYWHFDDRAGLLEAVLEDWRTRMISDVNVRAEGNDITVNGTLEYLLALTRRKRPDRNGAIERSVRDWARMDPRTKAAVVEVDEMRLAFFQALFRRYGLPDRDVRLRAYAAYALVMGDSILKDTINLDCPAEEYLNLIMRLLLGEESKKMKR